MNNQTAYAISAINAQLECELTEAEWMQTHIYDKWKKKCYFTQNINKIEVIIDNSGFSIVLLYNNKDSEIVATYETEQQAAKALEQLFDGIISEDGRIDSDELNEHKKILAQKILAQKTLAQNSTEINYTANIKIMYIIAGVILGLVVLLSIIIVCIDQTELFSKIPKNY